MQGIRLPNFKYTSESSTNFCKVLSTTNIDCHINNRVSKSTELVAIKKEVKNNNIVDDIKFLQHSLNIGKKVTKEEWVTCVIRDEVHIENALIQIFICYGYVRIIFSFFSIVQNQID